jgi:hypothetical protein
MSDWPLKRFAEKHWRGDAPALLWLNARPFDDRAPLGDVGLDLRGQLGRRRADHGDAHFFELSLGHRIAYRGNAIGMELTHDRRRRFRRYEQGDP